MHIPIHHILLHQDMKRIHLLECPPQSFHKWPLQPCNQLHQILPVPEPQLLQMRISRPRINRPEEDLLLDIHEPHFFHPALIIPHNPKISTEFEARVDHVGIPFPEVAAGEGIVVGLCGEFTILHLHVAAWGEGGEGTLEHLFGFGEAA